MSMSTKQDTSRLLGFSDAVFALSATLLVVTLEVPDSYDALLDAIAGFPAFALGFAAIVSLWNNHRNFFTHYPLRDSWTVLLNSLLLFIVLLYVYPLKLLTQAMAERFLGAAPEITAQMGFAELQGMYLIFGAAVLAVFGVFLLMHLRAWQMRAELRLDALGCFDLRQEIASYAVLVVLSLMAIITAALGWGASWGLPIWLLVVAPVYEVSKGRWTSRRRQQINLGESDGQ
jgi:uncharacterized membrane protein